MDYFFTPFKSRSTVSLKAKIFPQFTLYSVLDKPVIYILYSNFDLPRGGGGGNLTPALQPSSWMNFEINCFFLVACSQHIHQDGKLSNRLVTSVTSVNLETKGEEWREEHDLLKHYLNLHTYAHDSN